MIEKVYGVDINPQYLSECKKRYSNLNEILECLCIDLTKTKLELPHTDIIIADLLLEYIGYESFKNVIKIVKPVYISTIIQINTETTFVSKSPYLHVFDDLNKIHHQIDEKSLITCMENIGYFLINKDEQSLPNEKKLVQLDFKC
ncbi:class I SAM-dependent methyltransferase [Thomasclavelia sp.]